MYIVVCKVDVSYFFLYDKNMFCNNKKKNEVFLFFYCDFVVGKVEDDIFSFFVSVEGFFFFG